jgi:hypothetical protein
MLYNLGESRVVDMEGMANDPAPAPGQHETLQLIEQRLVHLRVEEGFPGLSSSDNPPSGISKVKPLIGWAFNFLAIQAANAIFSSTVVLIKVTLELWT